MKRHEAPVDTENNNEVQFSDAELAAINLRLRQMGDAGLRAAAQITRPDLEQV
jgi:hypothetical protein